MRVDPMTKAEALAEVAEMATEIAGYRGKLSSWAYSPDRLDQLAAEALRGRAARVSRAITALADAEVAEVATALERACAGDEYAAKEIAGRFLSAVRRTRLVEAIRRHPRAAVFSTLVEAIERGRFTKAQMELARKLAQEAA